MLLVHPGGPFFARKDAGSWSIPKGEYDAHEEPVDAAFREFFEETGHRLDRANALALHPVKQKSGKWVNAWAVRGELDPDSVVSNTFEMEWPPKSGRRQNYPEIDRAAWFDLDTARLKINPGQVPLLDELKELMEHSH